MFPEEITSKYIISLCLGFIALIIIVIGHFFKKRRHFYLAQITANLFLCTSFLFLEKYLACIGIGIACIRTTLYLIFEIKGKEFPIWLVCLLCAALIADIIFMWNNVLDLLSGLALLIVTIALKIKDFAITKISLLFSCSLFIVYDICNFAYTDVLIKAFEIVSIIISLIILKKNRKEEQNDVKETESVKV